MKNTNDFLPPSYDIPSKPSGYMKLIEGENRFRILCSPIIGWETWETGKGNSKTPIRHHMDEPFDINNVEDPKSIKHFWAMAVYNYAEERIQILEITQKSIQKSIRALAKDKDWGSPTGYDLVIMRTGKQLDTEYSVNPKPAKAIDPAILQVYEDMHINLDALFLGNDPFQSDGEEIARDAERMGL